MARMREHQMPSEETVPGREDADAPKETAPYATVDTPRRLRIAGVVLVVLFAIVALVVAIAAFG